MVLPAPLWVCCQGSNTQAGNESQVPLTCLALLSHFSCCELPSFWAPPTSSHAGTAADCHLGATAEEGDFSVSTRVVYCIVLFLNKQDTVIVQWACLSFVTSSALKGVMRCTVWAEKDLMCSPSSILRFALIGIKAFGVMVLWLKLSGFVWSTRVWGWWSSGMVQALPKTFKRVRMWMEDDRMNDVRVPPSNRDSRLPLNIAQFLLCLTRWNMNGCYGWLIIYEHHVVIPGFLNYCFSWTHV